MQVRGFYLVDAHDSRMLIRNYLAQEIETEEIDEMIRNGLT